MFETADEKTQQLKVGIFVLCGVLWVFLSGFRWLGFFCLFSVWWVVFYFVGPFLFSFGVFFCYFSFVCISFVCF